MERLKVYSKVPKEIPLELSLSNTLSEYERKGAKNFVGQRSDMGDKESVAVVWDMPDETQMYIAVAVDKEDGDKLYDTFSRVCMKFNVTI